MNGILSGEKWPWHPYIERGTRAGCHSDKTMNASTAKCNLYSLYVSGTVDPACIRCIGLSNLKCFCEVVWLSNIIEQESGWPIYRFWLWCAVEPVNDAFEILLMVSSIKVELSNTRLVVGNSQPQNNLKWPCASHWPTPKHDFYVL